jgi:glutamine synthetase
MPPCSRLQQRMRPLPVWRCEDVDLESKESSVEFGSIEIREYNRELGVYADLKNGLALGWEYEQQAPIPVDQYRKKEATPKPTSPRGGLKRVLKKLKGTSEER